VLCMVPKAFPIKQTIAKKNTHNTDKKQLDIFTVDSR
jgi:hypothetical protein